MKYAFILMITILTSCSVINKHKAKEKSHSTENTVAKDDIKSSSKKDSAHLQTKVSDTLTEDMIAIEFDNEGFAQDDVHIHEYDSPAVYIHADTARSFHYQIGTKIIQSPRPIKKLITRNTSQAKKSESIATEVKAKDTTHQVRTVQSIKTADIKKTDLTKKTKNYAPLVIGILLSLVAGYLLFNLLGYVKGWEGIWFLFRRKKDQSNQT